MPTPFDEVVGWIRQHGYHNHRQESHSDIVSTGVWNDLYTRCEAIKRDHNREAIKVWYNVRAPGGRHRRVDLFIGVPDAAGAPDMNSVRVAIENKSVITAHRNRTNRFDDLNDFVAVLHARTPVAILAATVIVGLAERVLNVPDRVRPHCPDFEQRVLPRLSTGDQTLWTEFPTAISYNRATDPVRTAEMFRTIPTRQRAHTHEEAFDYLLLVPMFVNNVDPPALPQTEMLGVLVEHDYNRMIEHVCSAYTARWG